MDDAPTARWDRLVAEMDATADDYRRAGTEPVALHPVDVSLVADDGVEFAALVGGDEASRLAAVVAAHGFAGGERQTGVETAGEVVLAALAVESADGAAVVLVPLYYRRTPVEEGRLRDADGVAVRVRDHAGETVAGFELASDGLLPSDPFDG